MPGQAHLAQLLAANGLCKRHQWVALGALLLLRLLWWLLLLLWRLRRLRLLASQHLLQLVLARLWPN